MKTNENNSFWEIFKKPLFWMFSILIPSLYMIMSIPKFENKSLSYIFSHFIISIIITICILLLIRYSHWLNEKY